MLSISQIKIRVRKILISIFSRLPVSAQVISKIRELQQELREKEAHISEQENQIHVLEKRLTCIDPEEVVVNLFDLLEGERKADTWQFFHRELAYHYDQFSQGLGDNISDEQLLHMLSLLLIPVARNGLKDQETGTELFYLAQSMDVHILPVHFYSPVPDTTKISDWNWNFRFEHGFSLNEYSQIELINHLRDYARELENVPAGRENVNRGEFYWNNPAFGPMDATVYYALIRDLKPARVLEVGSGYSTMLASKAAQINGMTRVEVIEPYPLDFLCDGSCKIDRLQICPVQEVDVAVFESLEKNDILFIDSTHICKSGSDVNWIILNILPRLKAGVVVHFHDITIPWDYPREWVQEKRIFYNEQFLLLAYLIGNPHCEVLLANYYLGALHAEEMRAAFPFLSAWGGGSFWLRVI